VVAPRVSVRTALIAVAVIAVALGAVSWVERRRARFTGLAHYHLGRIAGLAVGRNPPTGLGLISIGSDGTGLTETQQRDDRRHFQLFLKYEHAARKPWRLFDDSED
jgi:hypothetical protein